MHVMPSSTAGCRRAFSDIKIDRYESSAHHNGTKKRIECPTTIKDIGRDGLLQRRCLVIIDNGGFS